MIIPNFSPSTHSSNINANSSPIQRKRVSNFQGLNDIDRWLYMAKRSKEDEAEKLCNTLHSASIQDLRKWEKHIQKTAWMFAYSS